MGGLRRIYNQAAGIPNIEMMGQPGGLGYYINLSKVWSAYYKVFASILVMALLFSLIMKILGLIQANVLRWQKGWVKE